MTRSVHAFMITIAMAVAAAALLVTAGCATSAEEQAVRTLQDAIRVARDGDLDRAADMFEEAHRERPGFVDPLMFLANVHERRGDLPAARDAYERALEIDPTLTAAGVSLALTYVGEGRPEEARAWLERALQADPGFEPTLFNLGMLSEHEHDAARAADWYRLAAVMDATASHALVRMATLHLAAGRAETARDLARRALARRPGDPAATSLLATIESRRPR